MQYAIRSIDLAQQLLQGLGQVGPFDEGHGFWRALMVDRQGVCVAIVADVRRRIAILQILKIR